MGPLLVILIFDMLVESLNIIGLSIASVLVQGQVVVGQITLELADIFDESLVFSLKGQVGRVIFVDVFDLLFHLVDLRRDVVVLRPQQVVVVVTIVDLPAWASTAGINAS